MATDAFTAAADGLYGLVPEDFTAARNARAKEAKAAGDRELADRLGGLRKPSPAAWIVNQLVRRHPDELDALLDLGEELRDAQASGDGKALTTIGGARRRLLSALLRQAIELADAADRSPSRAVLDEVEQTLIAATVDEAASRTLVTGRLVRSLQAVGFEPVDLDGAVAGEASAAPLTSRATRAERPVGRAERPGRTKAADADERRTAREQAEREAQAERDRRAREQAEADLRDARERAEVAERALAEAEDQLQAAEWNADELRDERHDLEARLKELRSEIAEAERDEREAERVRAKAAVAVDRARDDVEAAEAALAELE